MKKPLWRGLRARSVVKASDQPRNEYYENISARLGVLQVILFLSLFAFVVLAVLANTNLITYQNFYHFFKDLGASAETVDVFNADSVSYLTADEQSFAIYRKGLAVAGNNSVTIFSATGRQLLSVSVNYQNPKAAGAGKYLLVYESGGTKYSLYNSNVQIHSGESAKPIVGASVSDSGMYALICEGVDSTSLVSLYNDRFALINQYRKSGYVMGTAISSDGKRIAILTSSSAGASFSTTLMLAEPGKGEAIAETVVGSTAGVGCGFTSSGNVSVLCSGGVTYLDPKGRVYMEYDFEGKIPALADLSADGVAVCLKKTVIAPKNIVMVFDKNGEIVYNNSIPNQAEQILLYGNSVFWVYENGVDRLRLSDKAVCSVQMPTAQRIFLAVSERELLSCSPQKAVYVALDY